MIVSYDVHFGEIHDSKEFKKTLEILNREIVSKLRIVIGDKVYDSEKENHIIAKKHALLAIILARNEDVLVYRTKGEKREDEEAFARRLQRRLIVETVHSVLKKKSGSFVRSRIP